MPDSVQLLVERLDSEGNKTVSIFQQLHDPDWDTVLYADGEEWTVRQLLAHFVTAEVGMQRLVENILQGGSGSAEDFDIDAYNARHVSRLHEAQPAALLEMFANQRRQTIAQVARLTAADLLRGGRHPYLGQTTLADIIKMMYRHNQIHQRDLRRALDAAS